MIDMSLENPHTAMDWKVFLSLCRQVLGRGSWNPQQSESWCAYTTFASLAHNVVYWSCGFPELSDLLDEGTRDGGLWRQTFHYDDLAHVVVPARFYWEDCTDGNFSCGYKTQDIDRLSLKLHEAGIPHRKTELMLEVKLY